jgi:RNA polymerase sigma factor (sigma-70 family)
LTAHRRLAREILDGNKGAFESLVKEFQAMVVHIVSRMVLDPADREDLYQDVFMKVYQNLADFRFESKLSTWIATIANNTCLNHLRKKRESPLEETFPGIESADQLPGNHVMPDENVERSDLALRLQSEIDRMPPHFRAIVTLYHLEGMSYGEIAEVLNLPEGTVKSHLFRGRRLLKERLARRYRQEDIV